MVVTVGDKIPLSLQVYDGKVDLKIKAEIYSLYGDLLGSASLHHVSRGLYVSSDLIMPNVPAVIARYEVTSSEDYAVVEEKFKSCPQPKVEEQFIYGEVVSKEKDTEWIVGVMS